MLLYEILEPHKEGEKILRVQQIFMRYYLKFPAVLSACLVVKAVSSLTSACLL